jgi:hypothetical protein
MYPKGLVSITSLDLATSDLTQCDCVCVLYNCATELSPSRLDLRHQHQEEFEAGECIQRRRCRLKYANYMFPCLGYRNLDRRQASFLPGAPGQAFRAHALVDGPKARILLEQTDEMMVFIYYEICNTRMRFEF